MCLSPPTLKNCESGHNSNRASIMMRIRHVNHNVSDRRHVHISSATLQFLYAFHGDLRSYAAKGPASTGVGDRLGSLQGAVSFCRFVHGGCAKYCGIKDRSQNMAIPVCILVADGQTIYGSLASCIPGDQRSPAPLVTTTPLVFAPCTRRAEILSKGNKQLHFLALALWPP
jgi:hypothetical protein